MTQLKEMSDHLSKLIEEEKRGRAGAPIKLVDICSRPGALILKPFFARKFEGKLDAWHDANDLREMVEAEVAMLEGDVPAPPTPSSVSMGSDWKEESDTHDSYDDVVTKFEAESERKVANKHSAATSSAATTSKRKATEPLTLMEVDDGAAAAKAADPIGEVDFDED